MPTMTLQEALLNARCVEDEVRAGHIRRAITLLRDGFSSTYSDQEAATRKIAAGRGRVAREFQKFVANWESLMGVQLGHSKGGSRVHH